MAEVGCRVVRGPDWIWEDQDGGEGYVGTVVKVGGNCREPERTVFVVWDQGAETNYRIGYDGAYDLRLFDNAQAGVRHEGIVCNSCLSHNVWGFRWSCQTCPDFDLCSTCYFSDKHDITHPFLRFTHPESLGVEVGVRKGLQKVTFKGIYVGAKVCRGLKWEWGDQDGGIGGTGRVLEVRGWDNDTSRSVVQVAWSSGTRNIYRLGHKGKVDLKLVEATSAGTYYPSHLPIFGKDEECWTFTVGDRVAVKVSAGTLEELQADHGGWHPRMEQVIGLFGTVHRLTDKGDVRVEFDLKEGGSTKWTINPAALARVDRFSVGDLVCISSNRAAVEHYQQGHGEWTSAMTSILGQVGNIVKVYSDLDLRVRVNGCVWTLSPLAVTLLPPGFIDPALPAADLFNNVGEEVHLNSGMKDLAIGEVVSPEIVLKKAAQGFLDPVQEYLNAYPDKVDTRVSGKTLLQVTSHQGHTRIVSFLLQKGASVSLLDDEGDSPLHYAAFGNQPEVMRVLIQAGANINTPNASHCTPLHISVSKQHPACVEMLLNHNPNVNLQDSYGDTALHDAIGVTSVETATHIMEQLCQYPGIDFSIKNKRGFNTLHHAALKGNTLGCEKIVSRCRYLVDIKKDDGFSPLHLACLNGHKTTAEVLLNVGSASIDITNSKSFTPLMLAACQGFAAVVELLVCSGASLTALDEDGDSVLHMVLLKRASISLDIPELDAPTIYGVWQEVRGEVTDGVAVAIACYLVQEGAPLDLLNSKGKTPLDLISGTNIPALLVKYTPQLKLEKIVDSRPVECMVCSELSDNNVLLEPCGHKIACEDCTARMKKCLKCQKLIDKRVTPDGRIIAYKSRQPNAECLRYLESKIAEIEEVHCCSICMERRKNVAFLCGHGACDKCSQTLRTCHMCRKTITKKINLY